MSPSKKWIGTLGALFCLAGAPHADVLVHVVQGIATADDASIVPPTTLPSADFNSPDINFHADADSSATSLADFLNNPVFFNQQNGFDPTQGSNNIFLRITGSTFLAAGDNAFVVGHDDGVVLTFADPAIGTVVNEPGPTDFVDTPFNVTVAVAGFYEFDLKYAECCEGPADLVFQINDAPIGGAVPEPATLVLLGLGLAGLGFSRRRAMEKSK